ncbi:MAG: hypothetical protein U9R69_09260, partial [Thermodesulfobacteriota bacterium]|nr:hypothetical protein [Thermodesulfobacteriota bacterium]
WMLLPFFLLFALISGIVNGLATDYLLASLYKHPAFSGLKARPAHARSLSENRKGYCETV